MAGSARLDRKGLRVPLGLQEQQGLRARTARMVFRVLLEQQDLRARMVPLVLPEPRVRRGLRARTARMVFRELLERLGLRVQMVPLVLPEPRVRRGLRARTARMVFQELLERLGLRVQMVCRELLGQQEPRDQPAQQEQISQPPMPACGSHPATRQRYRLPSVLQRPRPRELPRQETSPSRTA